MIIRGTAMVLWGGSVSAKQLAFQRFLGPRTCEAQLKTLVAKAVPSTYSYW